MLIGVGDGDAPTAKNRQLPQRSCRSGDGSWSCHPAIGDAPLHLPSLDLTIPAALIYERVGPSGLAAAWPVLNHLAQSSRPWREAIRAADSWS